MGLSASYDVVVIGGGVIGLATAWQLADSGAETLVVADESALSTTSAVAGGMIAPTSEASLHESGLLELSLRSAELYPQFVRQIEDQSGIDLHYRTVGTLLVGQSSDDSEWLKHEQALRQRLGLLTERVTSFQLSELEPGLSPRVVGGLSVKGDASIYPQSLLVGLAKAFKAAGGEYLQEHVQSVTVSDGRVDAIVTASGQRVATGTVVAAAGAWSGQLEGVSDSELPPVRPVKGEIVELLDPTGDGLLKRVVRGRDVYVVPHGSVTTDRERLGSLYRVGATVKEQGFDRSATAGGVYELLKYAIQLVPGLDDCVVHRQVQAGLRPATPDGLPIIGSAGTKGLIWATGHYRNGIALAPVTAQLVAELVTQEALPEWASVLSAERFV